MSEAQIRPAIYTICRDCIFNKTENGVQTGCVLNKLEALENNGATIEKESNYFKIIDRYCNSCRNAEWATKYEGNLITEMEKELSDKLMDVIIILTNNKLDKFLQTLDSVLSQSIKPNKIIVSAAHNVWRRTINRIVSELKNRKVAKWQLTQAMSEKDEKWLKGPGGEHRYYDELDYINNGQKKSDALFFVTVQSGYNLPSNFIYVINELINKKMERFVTVLPIDGEYNGLVIQNKIFSMIGGNDMRTALDKIKQLADEQNAKYMIREAEFA